MTDQALFELLCQLIDTPSTSGSETAVLELVESLLQGHGLTCQRIAVQPDRWNLLATHGQPKVLLQAHIDVVPPHLPSRQTDSQIFGRGACDTKGSVASMITAALRQIEAGNTNFGLLFTVSEETDFAGTMACIADDSRQWPYMVVGEPSLLQPITQHYGLTTITVAAHGKASHSSEPQAGINAIDLLTQILSQDVPQLPLHPATLLSVVLIKGGTADNIIPDYAEAVISLRVAPTDTNDYPALLQDLVQEKGKVTASVVPPVASSIPEHLAFLGEGQTVKYCTELAFFQKGVILGPGDIKQAHTDNEFVDKSQLVEAAKIYQKIIEASQ